MPPRIRSITTQRFIQKGIGDAVRTPASAAASASIRSKFWNQSAENVEISSRGGAGGRRPRPQQQYRNYHQTRGFHHHSICLTGIINRPSLVLKVSPNHQLSTTLSPSCSLPSSSSFAPSPAPSSKFGVPGQWRLFSAGENPNNSNNNTDNGLNFRNTSPVPTNFFVDQTDERVVKKNEEDDGQVPKFQIQTQHRHHLSQPYNSHSSTNHLHDNQTIRQEEALQKAFITTVIHHALTRRNRQRRNLSSSSNNDKNGDHQPTSSIPSETVDSQDSSKSNSTNTAGSDYSSFDYDEHTASPRGLSSLTEPVLHVSDKDVNSVSPSSPTGATTSTGASPAGDDDQSSSSSSTSTSRFSSIIQVPKYSQDAERAVRSLQQAQKERARAKTAANVRRALIGNLVICVSKFGAWLSSGSSSMMSEFVHSVVDCGNQSLLLMGLRDSRNVADNRHPYGYGKSVYFWALVSALGTFFLGAGISMSHAVQELWNPSLSVITNEVWAVLVMSFFVDGYVLYKTVSEIESERPKTMSFFQFTSQIRDPATLAVLLEDGAACLGILIAIAGISASHATGNPVFDGMAGVGISGLLGGIGLALVRMNHRFLIGQGVNRTMLDDIERIITTRRSIDHVSNIQSQWTGPETFSFKAEVDFDGTYLAAHLMPRYKSEFDKAKGSLDQELDVLLSWYAEDVIRAVEREIRHIESMIRQKYPGAEYIELEPMSKHVDRFAIDDSVEEKLLLIEKEAIQRFIRVVHQREKEKEPKWSSPKTGKAPGSSSTESNDP